METFIIEIINFQSHIKEVFVQSLQEARNCLYKFSVLIWSKDLRAYCVYSV